MATRTKAKPIRRTTGKGGNYRPTKSGAGMTKKGVKAYRKANPGSKLKTAVTKTAALTNDVDLIPYIGIEAGAGAAEALHVHYECISRTINE